ncbi:NAD-dependent succinate-semialdehyde dehydrogenase [Aurantiacibacter gangjinensis]|uniref:Succinate-semialdehyde dehydrogenase n=1 Tax=Aurantiacibacter gangjinensis TaxID=502682 RepID=A0A0G9MSG3_9SPHN|nr:NAD-dependent succinate-semialdehyde dehydrogenase [Aurantiacibacter gangjinensis]APE29131.1 Succinate-semialdehyde dehydrogenase [NAD]; Succinate-semialdehyde dehydrogenase [NAD(P)+] [Aurantiacibacter gangjinensis]KLE33677.1 succinate-semialdehyde dehydrogenase [Aurantiacibacter gangjinensis]
MSITTVNPATGEDIETYETLSQDDACAKVDACHKAHSEWKLRSLEDRASVIRDLGQGLRDNKEELAQLMTREVGKLIKDSRDEVELCAAICDYTAENGPSELADQQREPDNAGRGIVTFSPIGVVYGIQPWNFPAYQVIRYAIASLMVGNGVLLKHASICTGSGLMIERIFRDAGLPEDLFTVLVIDHDTSDAIIAHDKVRGVTLTGSDGAGKHVAEKAGKLLKKTVLELGSNDAYLVLEDADIDTAVEVCAQARLYNNGQTCINGKRFVVTDAVYDEFVEKYVERFKSIKTGDPTAEDTDMGPMSNADLRDDLQEQVDKSVSGGAKIACGGAIPDGAGAFYPATVLTDVAPGQPAYDDELFGPVASVIRAKDDEDAMRIANDSRYGLGGGILCKDEQRAIELASKHFDTGMVFINVYGVADPHMPFGGVKDSGYGREHGGFGIKEFANAKSIFVGPN